MTQTAVPEFDGDAVPQTVESARTAPRNWDEIDPREHLVQFYHSDHFLVESVAAFLAPAFNRGEGVLVIATEAHRLAIARQLQTMGVDAAAAVERGQYVPLDAAAILSLLMQGGESPDPQRFAETVEPAIAELAARWPSVRAFGEMVALLWEQGQQAAACRLEELWCDLGRRKTFSLFCAYPMGGFNNEADSAPFLQVCRHHTRVYPAETFPPASLPDEQFRAISVLQQKAQALDAEISQRKHVQEEFQDFVENAVEGLQKVSLEGQILWANKAQLDLLGFPEEDYVGRPVAEFLVDEETADDLLKRLGAGEGVADYPARLRTSGGSIKDVLIQANTKFESGQFAHSRWFIRDVTESKAADIDRALLAAIIESSDDGIVSKTLDGIITSWNMGAERLFGYSAGEAVGQSITMLIPRDRIQEESDIIQQLRRGERVDHFETVRRRKDGTLVDISLTISPIIAPDGKIVGASKIARDITERRKAEEALRQADRRKDEFVATLAHELRNPLAPICNGLFLLRTGNCPPAEVNRIYDMMERQVAHMVRLVDDLLELSRISRGKIELRPENVELSAVINHAVETSRPLIQAARHRLTVSLPSGSIILNGDEVRLTQIFANLLNNAVKYTEPGGDIAISAAVKDGFVTISVKDSGIGIAPEMLSRVFEMFSQVRGETQRSQDGLGIGLSLARTLVAMHGGSIEARSAGLGQGSEFLVRLPLVEQVAAVNSTKPDSSEKTPPSVPALRILAVDDNRDAVDSLALLLRRLGADVQTAYDGRSALEAIRTQTPSMIFLDIGMPGMNGYEVARRVRENPAYDKVTLVALTGWGQEEQRTRGEEAGFDYHLVKPVELGALQSLLRSRPN